MTTPPHLPPLTTHWHPAAVPESLLNAARDLRKRMTDAEQRLWTRLRGRQLDGFRFRKQHPIDRFVLDFYCPAMRLAIELDGGQHNTPEGEAKDAARTRFLEQQGIRVLRFWNHEVLGNLEGVMQVVWDVLHAAPNTPLPELRVGSAGNAWDAGEGGDLGLRDGDGDGNGSPPPDLPPLGGGA